MRSPSAVARRCRGPVGPGPTPGTTGGRHRARPAPERFNLALLWAGQFVNTAGLMMLVPIMPFYIEDMGVRDPQVAATWAGVAVAAPALALVVATPLWGRLGDRVGRKWMVVRALLGLSAAMAVMASATTPLALVLGRLLQGTLGGVVEAATGFAGTTGKRGQRGAALGKSFSATAAGSLVGPLAGGALVGAGGLRALMLVLSGVAASIAVLSALGLGEPRRESSPSDSSAPREPNDRPARWRLPVSARLAVAAAAAYLGVYGLIPLFAEYTRGIVAVPGSAGIWVGVAHSLTWGATLICSPLWGRYNDRAARPVRTFAWAALGCGLAIAAQALPIGLIPVLALRLVQGACFAALAQSLFFHAARIASERRAGGAVGSANSFLLAGQSVGPLLVGPVTVLLPITAVIAALGGACLVAGALALSVARREVAADSAAPSRPRQSADGEIGDGVLADGEGGDAACATTRFVSGGRSHDADHPTRPLPVRPTAADVVDGEARPVHRELEAARR